MSNIEIDSAWSVCTRARILINEPSRIPTILVLSLGFPYNVP